MNTNLDPNPSVPHAVTAEVIPEFWSPADGFEPVKTRHIPWLLAPLVAIPAMLAPRRFGPHLDRAGWKAAYLVHFLAAILTVGSTVAFAMRSSPAVTENVDLKDGLLVNPLTEIREFLAGAVLLSFYRWGSRWMVQELLIIIASIEAGVWLAAVLLVPLYAAGEGAKRTYLRCVKLTLWSTACQFPIVWLSYRLMFPFVKYVDDPQLWFYVFFVLFEFWWITVLYRLGGRYGGPREGPRWQPRCPRCEHCGYSLVGLSVSGNCPECNTSVADSLPERRRPTAFAAARGFFASGRAFFKTLFSVYRLKTFTRRTAIWGDFRRARNFAALVCAIIGLLFTATRFGVLSIQGEFSIQGKFMYAGLPDHQSASVWSLRFFSILMEPIAIILLFGLCGGLASAVLILLVGLFASRFGFRDCADRVVMLFHGSAWLLLFVVIAMLGGWTAYGIVEIWHPQGIIRLTHDTLIDYESMVWTGGFIPAFFLLVFGPRQVFMMFRYSSHANA